MDEMLASVTGPDGEFVDPTVTVGAAAGKAAAEALRRGEDPAEVPLMAASVSLTVRTEVVGIEHGAWCDGCMLSSAVKVTYAVQVGCQALMVTTRRRCLDGHGWID